MKKRITMILALCMMLQIFVPLSVNAEAEKLVIFNDITEIDWYYDSVNEVVDSGLMKGTSETTFSPDMTLSRAMVVTILYRMAAEPDVEGIENRFTDVPADEWYTSAVLWANKNGIVNGRGNGVFDPSADVTRAELATMLFRYVANNNLVFEQSKADHDFLDSYEIPEFARTAIKLLYRAEIIKGKNGDVIDPLGKATRAEAAALFSRFVDNTREQEFTLLEKYDGTINVKFRLFYGFNDPETTKPSDATPELKVDVKMNSFSPTIDNLSLRITNNKQTIEISSLGSNGDFEDIVTLRLLEVVPGENLMCEITLSIGGEAETYVIYPKVDVHWY